MSPGRAGSQASRELGRLARRLSLLSEKLRSARAHEHAADDRTALGFVAAYRRLLAVALRTEPDHLWPLAPDALTREVELTSLTEARRAAELPSLDDALSRGATLDEALVDVVRRLLRRKEHVRARSIAQTLQQDPGTRDVGRLGEALVAARIGVDNLAWTRFSAVPAELLARNCPEEYAFAAARSAPEAIDAFAEHILAADPFDARAALAVLKAAVATRRAATAQRLYDRLERSALPAESDVQTLDWLGEWVRRLAASGRPVDVTPGTIPFAVLTYNTPDWNQSSSNIGDYIQTAAALSHLARRTGLTFSGPPELTAPVESLAARVRDEARVSGPQCSIELVEMARDASSLDAIPPNTWTLAFGSYMSMPFKLNPDFPFHPNVLPIFVSFHIDRLELLTPEAVDYLRRHAPVGCRDWNTVHLLLGAGVPAFFSGCVSTTMGALVAARAADASKPVAYVDVDAPEGAPTISHEDAALRDRTPAQNVAAAVDLVESYQRDYSRIVTSRLQCYLPMRAIGADVEFRPDNPADLRFSGLTDAGSEDLDAMSRRITSLLGAVLDEIVSGAPAEDVYAAWQRACAPDMELAAERHAAIGPPPALPFDVDAEVAAVRRRAVHVKARAERVGAPVHVAIALDGNLKEQAKIVATGIADNTQRPVHLYVLCREHDAADFAAFSALFPEIDITWLPCDDVRYGEITGLLTHTTVSTMDRLLLPYLLPDVAKVVYHDIDALALADIGELYDMDIGGAPLAARDAPERKNRFGLRTVWAATGRMGEQPAVARDYVHRMARHLQHEFVSFNAGIMVLNLEVLRREGFKDNYLPWASAYGLNDQQLLNCYAGTVRAQLDPRWNALPAQEDVRDPLLVHWAGHTKPWHDEFTPYKDRWLAAERRVADRVSQVGDAAAPHGSPVPVTVGSGR